MSEFFNSLGPIGLAVFWGIIAAVAMKRGWGKVAIVSGIICVAFILAMGAGPHITGFGERFPSASATFVEDIFGW